MKERKKVEKKSVNELDVLQRKIAELEKSETRLKNTFKGLKVANRQFRENEKAIRDSEEILKATNQQLAASEQQLKALNQQLMSSKQEIRESEERLKDFQKITHLGYLDLDLEKNEVHWSDETYRIYGFNPKKFQPTLENTIKLVHPDDVDFVQKELEMVIKGVKDYDVEHRNICPDGTVIWLHEQAKIKCDKNGKPIRLLGTVLDITERKQAEEIVQFKIKLELLARELSTSFAGCDAGSFDTICNSALKKIALFSGGNRSSLFSISSKSDTLTNTHEWCEKQEDSQIALLKNIPFSTFGWHKDQLVEGKTISISKIEDYPREAKGEREWVTEHGYRSLLFVPLIKNKSLVGALGFYGEIGKEIMWPRELKEMLHTLGILITSTLERISAEKNLRDSQEKYRALAEYSVDSIFMINREFTVVYLNDFAANQFNSTKEKIIGIKVADLFPKQYSEGLLTDLKQVFYDKKLIRSEKIVTFPGRDLWLDTHLIPILDEEKNVKFVYGISRDVSERKNNEIKLQEASNRLIEAQTLAHLGNWEWDPVNDEVTGSEEFYRLFDVSDKSNLAKYNHFIERLHPNDIEHVQQDVADALKLSRPYNTEYRVKLNDGGWRYINARGQVLTDPDNKPMRMIGTCLDITERKLAEEELSGYEKIITTSKDMMALLDSNYTYRAVNRAYVNAFGRSKEELIGSTPTEIFGKEFFEKVIKTNADNCLEGNEVRYSEWFDFPVSGKRFMDISYTRFVGLDKIVKGFIINGHDITERKLTDDALKESEDRLKLAQSVAHTGFLDWNPVTNEIIWSDESYRIHGYKPREIEPTMEVSLAAVHPDDRELAGQSLNAALKGEAEHSIDHRLLMPDGGIRWVHATSEVIRDEDGKPIRVLGTHVDITKRKQAEIEIQKLNEELESRVIKRTAELQTANKELEAFSYSVSHDLRAPIRAMDGFTRLFAEEYSANLDEEGKRLINVVLRSAKKMGQLIDDLLTFSRLSRNKIKPVKINMRKLVNEVIEELYDSVTDRKTEITIKQLPQVNGDRALLRQVIVNLLSNSFKYTKPGETAIIEIGSFAKDHENIYYIKDNGVGFDMKYVHKIFDVFERLHSAKDFEGTGVGLAIVQKIIHRHGGKIWAEAEVNKGATFYFSLT